MEETRSSKLASEYVRLGGKRKAKLDDNMTSLRHWEGDSQEAEAFWQNSIASLDADEQEQVIKLLPSMNAD